MGVYGKSRMFLPRTIFEPKISFKSTKRNINFFLKKKTQFNFSSCPQPTVPNSLSIVGHGKLGHGGKAGARA